MDDPDDKLEQSIAVSVSEFTGTDLSRIRPSTRLLEDLGMDGDDALQFFIALKDRFGVDLSEFKFNQHFDTEGEIGLGCLMAPVYLFHRLLGDASPKDKTSICIADLVKAARAGRWTPP